MSQQRINVRSAKGEATAAVLIYSFRSMGYQWSIYNEMVTMYTLSNWSRAQAILLKNGSRLLSPSGEGTVSRSLFDYKSFLSKMIELLAAGSCLTQEVPLPFCAAH